MDIRIKTDGEIVDTGYGFVDDKGIEVCTDNELEEV